jgi:hypothetical protein
LASESAGNHCLTGSVYAKESKLSEARFSNNREIYREFFDFRPKIVVFCPNSAICCLEQGINREFADFVPSD